MEQYSHVDIAIITEGTYPYVKGGVSSVVHQVIEAHPDFSFGIIHICWDRNSPSKNQYSHLSQIKWVYPVYLTESGCDVCSDYFLNTLWMFPNQTIDHAISDFFAALDEVNHGNFKRFREIYHKYFNPLTRHLDFRSIFKTKNFLHYSLNKYKNLNISLDQLFWMQKELFSLGFSLLEKQYPKACVYHSHTSGYAGLVATLAAIQNESQFVLTEHSLYIQDITSSFNKDGLRSEKEIVKNNLWKSWFQQMGRIIYNECCYSTYLFQDIIPHAIKLGSHAQKVRIIPNGVDFHKFSKVREVQLERQKKRRENTLDEPWQIILLGRIVPVKGVLDLIHATNKLQERGSFKFHINLVGPIEEDRDYFRQCQTLVNDYGLAQIITFQGTQDVIKVLEVMDIMVLSSHSEALPVAILEAMACGIPVVGTDVGAMKQILQDPLFENKSCQIIGPAGVLVRSRDPMSLAGAILNIIKDISLFHEFAKNGPLRIRHSYSAEKVLSLYRKLYEPLLQSSKNSSVVSYNENENYVLEKNKTKSILEIENELIN